MRSLSMKVFGLIVLAVSAVPLAMGATISGTVKGPGGAPFDGAFVEAQNTTTSISTDVLSRQDGSYTVPNLPAGTYRLTIRAVGYKAAPQSQTLQSANQHAKADFALEKGTVRWSDLSVWQGRVLLPNGKGKDLFFGGGPTNETAFGIQGPCFACHNFQSRMSTRQLNYQGWMGMVNYMRRDAASFFLVPPIFTDQNANEAASYLTQVFGVDSNLPASPADLPGYQATVRKFSDEAMNFVYVVYPLADPTWLSFQMYPPTAANGLPSNGSIWVADYGNANRVVGIDPKTGKNTTYMAPCPHPAGIHAIEVGPHGDAWFAEQGCNRVGSVDPRTGKVTEFQDPYRPGKEWSIFGGSKHDAHPMLVDGKVYVFSSGSPASRLDPATGKFTHIAGIPSAYDVIQGNDGNVWFTEMHKNGSIDKVDPKTLKVTKYAPTVDPVTFYPHRIKMDSNGMVWVTCRASRICRLDPKTKAIKDFTPLGPRTARDDYAIGVGPDGGIWWSMSSLDTIQRLDPNTGHIVEYPFPYPEITMRKFFRDAHGRVWWASPANATVGYFYVEGHNRHAAK